MLENKNQMHIEKFIKEKKSIGLSEESLYYYERNLNLFMEFLGEDNIDDDTFFNYQLWLNEQFGCKENKHADICESYKSLFKMVS